MGIVDRKINLLHDRWSYAKEHEQKNPTVKAVAVKGITPLCIRVNISSF